MHEVAAPLVASAICSSYFTFMVSASAIALRAVGTSIITPRWLIW